MHQLINSNGHYEPSSSSKHRWLYTRKNKINYGDITLPGLFQTYNFKVDTYLFITVLVLEAYGVYVLWAILPTPVFAFVGLAMDIFCAIFAHIKKKNLCLAINKRLLSEHGITFTPGKNPLYDIHQQSAIINKSKLYEYLFYFIISILALVKVLTIFSFASSSEIVPGMKIFICMIYLATAYIHINHTGYYVFEIWFRYFSKKEKIKVDYTKSDLFIQNKITDSIVYFRKYKLENVYKEGNVYKQSIENVSGFSYLKNWGVLQDSELQGLVDLQDPDHQKRLAIELLNCQFNMLQNDANRAQTTILLNETKNN